MLSVRCVANLLTSALVIVEIQSRVDHHQRVSGLAWPPALLGRLIAVALLVCAVRMHRRPPFLRPVAVTGEAVIILAQLVQVVNGTAVAAVGIVLSATTVLLLSRPESTAWLRGAETAPVSPM